MFLRINGPVPQSHIRHFDCYYNPLEDFPALTHIHEAVCDSTHHLSLHMHETFELVYVVEGTGTWNFEGQEHRLHPGDLFVIQPGEAHGGHADPHTPYTTLIVGFDPASLPLLKRHTNSSSRPASIADAAEKRFFRNKDKCLRVWDKGALQPARVGKQVEVFADVVGIPLLRVLPRAYGAEPILRRLLSELSVPGDQGINRLLKTIMVQALLCELLVYIARGFTPHDKGLSQLGHRSLAEFTEWLNSRLDTPPTLAEMARQVGLSPAHFTVVFKRETGRTPLDYLNEQRLNNAAVRLRCESNVSVTQIAFDLGFSSPQYFSRAFHKWKGQSPTQWRRSNLPRQI